jgi:hypothetical protein
MAQWLDSCFGVKSLTLFRPRVLLEGDSGLSCSQRLLDPIRDRPHRRLDLRRLLPLEPVIHRRPDRSHERAQFHQLRAARLVLLLPPFDILPTRFAVPGANGVSRRRPEGKLARC